MGLPLPHSTSTAIVDLHTFLYLVDRFLSSLPPSTAITDSLVETLFQQIVTFDDDIALQYPTQRISDGGPSD